jgi:hypothetical protein
MCRKYTCVAVLACSLAVTNTVWADDGDDHGHGNPPPQQQASPNLLEFQLVPATMGNPLPTVALPFSVTDQIAPNSHLVVSRDGRVDVGFMLTAAAGMPSITSLTYNVWLCRFGSNSFTPPSLNGCFLLNPTDPTHLLTTDLTGRAQATFQFPASAPGMPFTGSFVITRDLNPEFINAFVFGQAAVQPEVQPPAGAEVELRGTIVPGSLNNSSFMLMTDSSVTLIMTSPATRFDKVFGFGGLQGGQRVEVEGVSQTAMNGTSFVFATRVKVEDDD